MSAFGYRAGLVLKLGRTGYFSAAAGRFGRARKSNTRAVTSVGNVCTIVLKFWTAAM
jgi:hypothetical protein